MSEIGTNKYPLSICFNETIELFSRSLFMINTKQTLTEDEMTHYSQVIFRLVVRNIINFDQINYIQEDAMLNDSFFSLMFTKKGVEDSNLIALSVNEQTHSGRKRWSAFGEQFQLCINTTPPPPASPPTTPAHHTFADFRLIELCMNACLRLSNLSLYCAGQFHFFFAKKHVRFSASTGWSTFYGFYLIYSICTPGVLYQVNITLLLWHVIGGNFCISKQFECT